MLAFTLRGISAIVPGFFRAAILTSLDARMIAFTLCGAMAGAVIAGVLPARRTLGIDAHQLLQRGTSSGRRVRGRSGRGLLVMQSALGTVLVAAAVLSIRSLFGLMTADLGFEPRGLYAGYGTLTQSSAPVSLTPDERLARARRKVELLREQPGIVAASSVSAVVFGRDAPDQISDQEGRRVIVRRVLDDYFAVMQTQVVAGRAFSAAEIAAARNVAIVNISAAKTLFPGDRAGEVVGRVVRFTGEPPRQIVAVVADTRPRPTDSVTPELFTPARPGDQLMSIFRVRSGVAIDATSLRPVFAAAGPVSVTLISAAATLEPGLQDPRLYADIFGVFAFVAVLLATVGLFAVASGDVSMRRYEMGVRLTLGASPRQLQRMVTSECVRPVIAGIGLGLVGAWWAGRLMQSLLHEVDPHDPATLAVVAAVLIVAALAASWWPARRAGRTDPAIVLRAQ
jgi:hypothetical protein